MYEEVFDEVEISGVDIDGDGGFDGVDFDGDG